MDKHEREALEEEIDFEQSRDSRVKALTKLIESKELINKAIDHERNDDNIGIESTVLVAVEEQIDVLFKNLFKEENAGD